MFEYPVVFVDIETTGGSYRNSRVLEVAAIRYENGLVVKEFSTLINPQTYIPSNITTLTGIAGHDVADAPVFAEIADELYEILEGAVFVAHNVRFDYSFLKQEFAQVGLHFSPKLLCTVRLSRALYPGSKGHSLAKLIERHSIPVHARHRALDDAQAILYFSQLAYDEHGDETFRVAVSRQLKTQYLPPHLNMSELDDIGNVPGVYIFRDEANQPVYVGKSITLKKRVLSHFQDQSPKEMKISQQVHHVETIPTGSELSALILESKLVKQLQPLFNRRLRRVKSYAMLIKEQDERGYERIKIQSGAVDVEVDLSRLYGLYESRIKAKKHLEEAIRVFGLCPKIMGMEKGTGPCFSYTLGKCRGACVGKESPAQYNRRFELALGTHKIATWPYDSAIVVPLSEHGESVVIDQWIVRGYLDAQGNHTLEDTESNFDVDEYKIIRQFIAKNRALVQVYRFST